MRFVFENPNKAELVAKKGSSFIKNNMNYKVAGKEILTRIKNL